MTITLKGKWRLTTDYRPSCGLPVVLRWGRKLRAYGPWDHIPGKRQRTASGFVARTLMNWSSDRFNRVHRERRFLCDFCPTNAANFRSFYSRGQIVKVPW
jgi:hypothetical protein